MCAPGGTAPLCGRVPRVPRVPWHRCASAAVPRLGSEAPRGDEPRPRSCQALGLGHAKHSHYTADYFLLTGKGLDNTNYRAAVAGAVSGAYHVRAMAEQYGVPVKESK